MTPEPTDFIRGARRTLEDVVLPALDDPFAIEQLKTVLRVLIHLEAVVDDAYPLEAAEAEDLGRFLGERDDRPQAPLPSYRELRDRNVQRKQRLAERIRACGRSPAVDDLVRRQLAREQRWTNPRRASK